METYKKLYIREQKLQDFFTVKLYNQKKSKKKYNLNDYFNILLDTDYKDVKFDILEKIHNFENTLRKEFKTDDIFIVLKGGNNYRLILKEYQAKNVEEIINKPSDYDFNLVVNPKLLTTKNIEKINQMTTLFLYDFVNEYLKNKKLLIKNKNIKDSKFSVVPFSEKNYTQSEYFVYNKSDIKIYYDFHREDGLKKENIYKTEIKKEDNYFKVSVFDGLINLDNKFNLYRLLLNSKLVSKEETTEGLSELIDISLILTINDFSLYKKDIETININYKKKDVKVNIYNLEGLIKDLIYTILISNVLPSADPKYEKRIDRLILLLDIYFHKHYSTNILIEVQKIIDFAISKINPKSGIRTDDNLRFSNHILTYLYESLKPLITLLSDVEINKELFEEKTFVKSKIYQYFKLLLTKKDLENTKGMIIYSKNLLSYRTFYYHLIGKLINLKKSIVAKKDVEMNTNINLTI